jgi:hypothetical protein
MVYLRANRAMRAKSRLKQRLERLERLERLTTQPPADRWPVMVWNMYPLPKGEIEQLAPNERVVNDWYRDLGGIVWSRERITTDPDDCGRRCEPDGYLIDALQEIHRDCWYRTQGVCRSCAGTPIAESHITP